MAAPRGHSQLCSSPWQRKRKYKRWGVQERRPPRLQSQRHDGAPGVSPGVKGRKGVRQVWVHSGYFDIIQQHRALGRGHHGGGDWADGWCALPHSPLPAFFPWCVADVDASLLLCPQQLLRSQRVEQYLKHLFSFRPSTSRLSLCAATMRGFGSWVLHKGQTPTFIILLQEGQSRKDRRPCRSLTPLSVLTRLHCLGAKF